MRRFIVCGIGLLLSIATVGAWSQARTPNTRFDAAAVRLPVLGDLRGKNCDEARAELRKLHFALETCPFGRTTGDYSPGTINAQSLKPGTSASQLDGLRVTLEPEPKSAPAATNSNAGAAAAIAAALAAAIANAKAPVLPDVRGKTCEQARAELRPLRVTLAECVPGRALGKYPAGTINAQSYVPGTPVSRVDGLRVRIEPSPPAPRPEPRLVLPNLRGKTCDEAAEELSGLRLKYASCATGDAVANYRPGGINWQSPNAGATLPLAGPLVLRVQPAPTVVVPALIGLGEAQAARLLDSRRLQVRASGPAASKGRRVLRQSPSAGTAVALGSAVQIGLGLSVPRLLGLDCAAARDLVAEYGHAQLECEARPTASPSETIGRVFEQTPPEGGAAIPAPAAIRVVLWVAQAVTVPDVRERTLDEAISTIETAKLVARPDQRQGERIVAQQSPAPGSVVDAGSAVRLDTREVVEVPDVVGQALGAAQSKLRQSRLRDAVDAEDDAENRIVQSQAPAAHARVGAESAVQLSTKRFATVPDLVDRTCAEARATVAPDTFGLNCNEESSWRVTVFGTPHVATQQPGPRSRAEVGATILAEARAPLPPSAQWLGKVPLAAVAGVVVAPFLGLGLWLAWPRTIPTPVPKPVASRVELPLVPPVVPPPRAPTFAWRVAADLSPSVTLRRPSDGKASKRGSRHLVPEIAWHVVPDTGHVLLREFDVPVGDDHADR